MPTVGVALQPLQVGSHLGGVLVAEGAIFLQGFTNDRVELRRNSRVLLTGQFRGLVEDGAIGRSVGISIERQAAAGHLVERHTEGKEVGAFVERFSRNLFR